MATRYLRFNPRHGATPQRAPLLERLLARADGWSACEDWRAEAYSALESAAPMPGLAAAAYRTRGAEAPQSERCWRAFATPLQYVAEMSSVRLATNGIVRLDEQEVAQLAADFGRIWSGSQFELEAVGPSLFCSSRAPLNAKQTDPERALGKHLQEFLPTGEDAPALKRLMSEIEMWLFDHEVNVKRRARGGQLVSALWLWGGGPPLDKVPTTLGCAAGDDVFFGAFACRSGCTENVMVIQDEPGSELWNATAAGWLQSALTDLRRGAVTRLDLSADGKRFAVTRRWRRRILRRARPWWEYFD